MSQIAMKAYHQLGKEEAERRLKERLRLARAVYGSQAVDLHEEWNDGTLSFEFETRGKHVAGTMTISDGEVQLVADVPLRVAIFKRLIEKRIRAELGGLLA